MRSKGRSVGCRWTVGGSCLGSSGVVRTLVCLGFLGSGCDSVHVVVFMSAVWVQVGTGTILFPFDRVFIYL